ncbi:helix-turn-helix transcriptional regulator [Fusibacter bizertensis]
MNNLSKYRNSKGLSQRDLAKELRVSSSTISMWETDERSPTISKAKEISDYFEASIEDIFFAEGDNIKLSGHTKD